MDSAEEVFNLLSRSVTEGISTATIEDHTVRPEWDAEKGRRFLSSLPKGSLQLSVIRALYNADLNGLSQEALMKELKVVDSQQLGGTFSGIAKNAKKLGLKSPLEIEKTRGQNGRRTYQYKLDATFRQLLENADQKKAEGRELPELRDFIRARRAALAGFMEQGAGLMLDGDELTVSARNKMYVRYLSDNRETIAALASEHLKRPITVRLETE
jgi:hypothetical protein